MRRAWAAAAALTIALCTNGAGQESDKKSEGFWDSKKPAWVGLTAAQKDQVFKFAEDYKAYLAAARTADTSTREVIRLAKAAGFSEFKDAGQVKAGAKLWINGRDRALILVVVGSDPIISGSRLVGTHHDSPHIDLKARPLYLSGGFALFNTVYYGGIKKYQWANRPLGLIGRVDTTDGKRVDVSIGFKEGDPVFVIADNAPHSDKPLRERKYQDVLSGEELDPVAGSIPGTDASVLAQVTATLTSMYGITEQDFVSSELALVPSAPPQDVGIDRGLVGAYGQDDRLSSYCAARALLDLSGTPKKTALAYLSNYEEEGSVNNTGAASQFYNNSLAKLVAAERGAKYTDLDLREALRRSEVISADVNDGINPIFTQQTSESTNAARLGYGVTIKKYGAGFDANSEFTARIRAILDKGGIAWQTQTPKVEGYSGGTIGGFLSAWDMEVIDIGVPLLSMHSPFEMSSKVDVWSFYRLMSAFYGS
ncbi:MAG: peptidase M18 [Thermoanaerobaculia bacterium]